MGLKRAWVFSCDAGACSWELTVHGDDPRVARVEALDHGWETVLRDEGDSGPMQTAWFCPMHRFDARMYTIPDEDHEAWCPRITRRGACQCEVSRMQPHTYDDAYGGTGRRGKPVKVVKTQGDIL
jgi:hypothetical protein